MLLSAPLPIMRYTPEYLVEQEPVRDPGVCFGPTCVNVRYKAEGRMCMFISEEDFWGQGSCLLCSKFKLLSLKREVLGQRKEMHPLENKTEFHHGCLDPRSLPKKFFFLKQKKISFRTE